MSFEIAEIPGEHQNATYWMCCYALAVQRATEEMYRIQIKIKALEKEIERLKQGKSLEDNIDTGIPPHAIYPSGRER